MGTYITADLLNQIGLFLGLISGLLLIPEVFNLVPIDKFEKSIERQLSIIESWAKFPLKFSPPSWRLRYTDEQREVIEPITAIRSLIFSIAWIALLVLGLRLSSKVFIILSFIILIAVVLGNMVMHLTLWRLLSPVKLVLIFIGMLFILAIVTPPISLLRVIMLILHSIAARIHSFFSANNVLRVMLTILAIIAFILSNVLQLAATFYE